MRVNSKSGKRARARRALQVEHALLEPSDPHRALKDSISKSLSSSLGTMFSKPAYGSGARLSAINKRRLVDHTTRTLRSLVGPDAQMEVSIHDSDDAKMTLNVRVYPTPAPSFVQLAVDVGKLKL